MSVEKWGLVKCSSVYCYFKWTKRENQPWSGFLEKPRGTLKAPSLIGSVSCNHYPDRFKQDRNVIPD